MAEDTTTRDRPAIYLTLLGERYELVLPGFGWTYAEAKLAKAISDGMAPVEIGQGFLNADPDAVMAIIRVTLHRAKRKLSTNDLNELAEIDLEHVAQAAMDGFRELSDNAATRNGASPTEPAEAGASTAPDGHSTNTATDSPAKNSEHGDTSKHASALDEAMRTAHEASENSGPRSLATS